MGEVASLEIEAGLQAQLAAGNKPPRCVEWLVCSVGFATAIMAIATACYKPPSGIFDDHKHVYYASVASTIVVGISEVYAASIWLSADVHRTNIQQRFTRRCVLCASILPLAFIADLGGVRMIIK